ncbi:MAG: hypothetical protein AAF630_00940 [Cyanobacteria bacterium P01_C01_bin.38]
MKKFVVAAKRFLFVFYNAPCPIPYAQSPITHYPLPITISLYDYLKILFAKMSGNQF